MSPRRPTVESRSKSKRVRALLPVASLLLFASCAVVACGSDSDSSANPSGSAGKGAGSGAPSGGGAHAGAASNGGAGQAGATLGADGGASDGGSAAAGASPDETGSAGAGGEPNDQAELLEEARLTLKLSLTVKPADGATAASASLQITARDGTVPIVTDLWLYTLEGDARTPITGFTSTAARKTPGLMLPAAIGGKPSGLSPADDGRQNGVMSNATRGTLLQGAFVNGVNGTVTVTLPAVPTTPILVIAGVEDQRYSGAALINADGTPGQAPAGVGEPESHVKRSFTRDVLPILKISCTLVCHNSAGPEGAAMYKMDTRELLVNDNFALTESSTDCQAKFPTDQTALNGCIQAITKAQFLVEPGAPALSDLLQRSRPDESAGTSASGLAWYGSGTPKVRYNAKYGDRRMPSTTISLASSDWTDLATDFDKDPAKFQVLYDWVAQGALP